MPRKNNRPVHTPFVFSSNCKSKRRFATERQALEAINHQAVVKSDVQLSTYKCELCGGWHLTRRPTNVQ